MKLLISFCCSFSLALLFSFDELRADPSKAKKPHHRPKDAREFAVKYLEGYYSLVKDEDIDSRADSKSHK